MRADPPGQPKQRPPRRSKRGLLFALAALIMVGGLGVLAYQLFWPTGEDDEGGAERFRRVVFPVKHQPAPAQLGVEYHFDRNAIVDSRIVESRIVGLTASGNLVSFDGESFGLRDEKVLHRRATCLGPVANGKVLVGIANGCIVNVAAANLAIERVDDVPGVPRWIGKRAKGGALLVAYQPDTDAGGSLWLKDLGQNRRYEIGARPSLFLDSQDRLWFASGDRVFSLNLETGARSEAEGKVGFAGLRGFAELGDGQVWAFGGDRRGNDKTSFIARVAPGPRPTMLYQAGAKRQAASGPTAPITHVVDDEAAGRVLVATPDGVMVSDRSVSSWQPLNAMGNSRRDDDALAARGQAHRIPRGVLLTLVRGGFMQLTTQSSRRHLLDGQNPVARPTEIVRLEKGMAFFGDGGPAFYTAGKWGALPDPVLPPAELMGAMRPGEGDRLWAAVLAIPLGGEDSYILAKAGVARHYLGHIHGLRDTVLTGRWDGKALTVLGREDLPIEPADTFTSPDKRLWNVDDQGLWSFASGKWKMVMRTTGGGHGKSAIGDPLHFAETPPPFHGLRTTGSSWALVRLDSNEEGGIPLIDEVAVQVNGQRVLVHDLASWEGKKDELLLATDHGLCVFNTKWSTCTPGRPDGLDEEVRLFKRDSSKRLWLAGRGLWLLRDLKRVTQVHSAIPMLADTRVVAMAEAADGRLVLGLEDRGAVFLTVPPAWLDRTPQLPGTAVAWESTRPHEPSYQDPGLVVRECREKSGALTDTMMNALVADLRAFADTVGPRVRVGTEAVFEGRPHIIVRGADPETLLKGVLGAVGKYSGKAHLGVAKRMGARGSETIDVLSCPE